MSNVQMSTDELAVVIYGITLVGLKNSLAAATNENTSLEADYAATDAALVALYDKLVEQYDALVPEPTIDNERQALVDEAIDSAFN